MQTFTWLRQGENAEKLKSAWEEDAPLSLAGGGTCYVLSEASYKDKARHLQEGGKHSGLGCLTWLSNELSYPGIKFSERNIERLGTKLWCGIDGDPDKIEFPFAWPEKVGLPVLLRDSQGLPARGKWKLLALDEVVASFWQFVDRAAHLHEEWMRKVGEEIGSGGEAPSGSADTAADSSGGDAPRSAAQEKAEYYKGQLEKARRLQRNVPLTLIYAATDREASDLALSLREEMDTFAEFCGLSMWNRLLVIGGRRDELQKSGLPCGPREVVQAFVGVRWGPHRDVTLPVAEKCLALYNRFVSLPAAASVFQEAQVTWSRQSPFEEWSKLSAISGICRQDSEVVWVLETAYFEKLLGKRTGNPSLAELTKKTSIVYVSMLRRRAVQAVLTTFVQAAIALGRPGGETDALKSFTAEFATVKAYFAKRQEAGGDAPRDGGCQLLLPMWCALNARKILRQLMDGRKDDVLAGLCSSPPRGGFTAITWQHHISVAKGLAEEVQSLTTQFDAWKRSLHQESAPPEPETGDAEGTKKASEHAPEPETGDVEEPEIAELSELARLQQELAELSQERRLAVASLIPMPETVLATTTIIKASSVYTRAVESPGPQKLVYIYAVGCSYDHARPLPGQSDKRHCRPLPLWKSDFEAFAATVNALVTAENESHAIVFCGRARRQGAGLAVEAGVALEKQILDVFQKQEGASWRAKRLCLMTARDGTHSRGAAGVLTESVLILYKGTWPRTLVPAKRVALGGTTWDDVWRDAPPVDVTSLPKIPYQLKSTILQNAWPSSGAPEEAEEECDDDDTEGGCKRKLEGEEAEAETPRKKCKSDGTKAKEGGKEKKHKKKDKKKDKKGKTRTKGKNDKTEKTKNKQPEKIPEPKFIQEALSTEDREPLIHQDLPMLVWRQALVEWGAQGQVVFTVGNAGAILAGIHEELPTLALCMNETHVACTAYAVDCHLAHSMQVQSAQNKLFNHELQERIVQAMTESETSGNADEHKGSFDCQSPEEGEEKEEDAE